MVDLCRLVQLLLPIPRLLVSASRWMSKCQGQLPYPPGQEFLNISFLAGSLGSQVWH